jgi:type III pantothenate kinase
VTPGLLLADCGNTAIKLGLGTKRVRVQAGAVPEWLAAHHPSALVLLPGAASTTQSLLDAWAGRGPVRRVGAELHIPALGQYPSLGLDRIIAGVAAGPACVVIDAGTATTLTAWNAVGRFAGGLILPGAHALCAGLTACAPALPLVTPLPPTAKAAQHDTPGAIGAAAGIGHPAMVAACLAHLQAETGLTRLVATGGGAETLAAAGIIPAAALRPWLVLEGLERLVSDADRA